MQVPLFKAMLAEFMGTFTLVFIGAGAVALNYGGLVGIAFAHGLAVMAIIYSYGAISGAHFNPSVTIGFFIIRKISFQRGAAYIVMQLLGAALAALVLRVFLSGAESGLGETVLATRLLTEQGNEISVSPLLGLFIEAVLTFFFVTTIMSTAGQNKAGNAAGLIIGLSLVACILVGGPLTGASLNPARSFGPAVATGNFTDLWVYVSGPILGAVVASLTSNWLFKQ